ncbi:MAG: TonB-dependent hemoglobin/transferrin/lactoferrin family receptor [Pseudomonadota bacterium]
MNQRLLLLIGALAAVPGYAQETPTGDSESDRDTITVIGTRTERSITEVPVTVSVYDEELIAEQLTRDIADLIRYEPGVTVGGTGSRFGLQGFSIRGIGGNRVLTVVDGVRVPEEFAFGPFLAAQRDFVDIDSITRAEIARGPISSLYGSDAIGGVVSFTTKRPDDYLGNDSLYLGGKLGWSGADSSVAAVGTVAAGNDVLSGLLTVTQRDFSETENQGSVAGTGSGRELPDPQDLSSTSVLAKLDWQVADGHLLGLAVDRLESDAETQILSDYGSVVFGTVVDTRDADDTRSRTRVSVNYQGELQLPFADFVNATAYTQSSETEQVTRENRTSFSGPQRRLRVSSYEQDISGAFAQASKQFSVGNSTHTLTYGLDYFKTENETLRNGGTSAPDGTPIPEFLPLPTRDFPNTEVTQTALFVQNEISLLNGQLLLSPGLRYDSFDASTSADAIYLNGNPGVGVPEDYDDSEVTGRFGAVYKVTDAVSVYALYSQGFRAPPYDDVNVGFSNFIGGYKTIANPNLESERSTGLEAGIRYQNDRFSVSVNAFHTDFENFIQSLSVAPAFLQTGGVDPSDNLLTFQSINREDVEIRGGELSAEVNLDDLFELGRFTLRGAVAYADGLDNGTGQPIDDIEPLTGVVGLQFLAPSTRWGGELVLTAVDGKKDSDVTNPGQRLQTSGYGIVDLLAFADLTERVSVNIGLFNLTDRDYIRWVDTNGIGGDAPLRFSQPGTNAAVNLRVEF